MENEVTKIFSSMPNIELVIAIKEIKEDDLQGFTRVDGIVRQKCKIMQEITGGNVYYKK